MPIKRQVRLDECLVDRELLPDLKTARGWIMAGKVTVEGHPISKPGAPIDPEANIALRGAYSRFASRGGYKLEAALKRFNVNVENRVVLDAGSAAGGFSDCLLQRGASLVYSVDVGYGQLRGKLASDPRIVNLERTNISDLKIEQFRPPLDLCVADLSYLSLVVALPVLMSLFVASPRIIALVKPLFEGLKQHEIRDPDALSVVLTNLFDQLESEGISIADVMVSPIFGGRGAVEFLILIDNNLANSSRSDLVDRAIAELATAPPTSAIPE